MPVLSPELLLVLSELPIQPGRRPAQVSRREMARSYARDRLACPNFYPNNPSALNSLTEDLNKEEELAQTSESVCAGS